MYYFLYILVFQNKLLMLKKKKNTGWCTVISHVQSSHPSLPLEHPNVHLNLEQDALLFLDMQAPQAILAGTVALGPVGREDHTSWL